MVGIYFSGTGNTRHCINKFFEYYAETAPIISIEDTSAIDAIMQNDFIVFAYPIYYSNLPKIVRDFINTNKDLFKNKKIFIIATMGLFSGDGTGCSARLFKKYDAEIVGGVHIKMPDCIGDVTLLLKTKEQNKQIIKEADDKISCTVTNLKNGKPPKDGLNFLYHMVGLFGQRLWFMSKTKEYSDKLKIDTSKCVSCGTCSKICPMDNLELVDNKIKAKGKCTMCYRCVNTCPNQAITLLGSEIHEQHKFENYID